MLKGSKDKLLFVVDSIFIFGCILSNLFYFSGWRIANNFKISVNKKKAIAVMGNGPSADLDLDIVLKERKSMSLLVFNKFCLSDMFYTFKPENYVIHDRRFWDSNCEYESADLRAKIISEIYKVEWPMNLFLPVAARSEVQSLLLGNKNIYINYYNERSLPCLTSMASDFALRNQICSPRSINALVVGVWITFLLEYRTVKVYGADFDFFKGLNTDQDTNNVFFSIKHFYGVDKSIESNQSCKAISLGHKPFHVRLAQASDAFLQMEYLSRIADRKNISLINSSSFSLLDSLRRK